MSRMSCSVQKASLTLIHAKDPFAASFEYDWPVEGNSSPVFSTSHELTALALTWQLETEFLAQNYSKNIYRLKCKLLSCSKVYVRGRVKCTYADYEQKSLSANGEWDGRFQLPYQFTDSLIRSQNTKGKVLVSIEVECADDVYCSLPRDMARLMDGAKWSDCTLLVDGQKFHAHKAILAARSPVFARMFESDMLEKRKHENEIHGDDPKIFEAMLRSLYTGQVQDSKQNKIDLIAIADKYGLDDLKAHCELILEKDLSVDNMMDVLIFAHSYKFVNLKAKAISFAAQHRQDVPKTEGYKQLLKSEHWFLVDELFRAVVS